MEGERPRDWRVPTPAERSALLFVAAVAALGLGVRGCRAIRPTAPPAAREALAVQLAAVDSAIAAGGRRPARRPRANAPASGADRPAPRAKAATRAETAPRAASETVPRSSGPSEPIDLNSASLAELDRLPGIGPSLAARIVAHRDSAGPFESLEALQRVRGIGPALAAKLAPFVIFSGRHPSRER